MEYGRAANLAGSLRTSFAGYTLFVAALRADAQTVEPRRLLSVEAAAEQRGVQARLDDPSIAWLITPQAGFDYGLNVRRQRVRDFSEAEVLGSNDCLRSRLSASGSGAAREARRFIPYPAGHSA
jgi:uncharacterized protein (DUF1778 family)